jgi:hypothetical protein
MDIVLANLKFEIKLLPFTGHDGDGGHLWEPAHRLRPAFQL